MIYVLDQRINAPGIGKIDILRYLNDEESMSKASEGVSTRSDCVFTGENWCIRWMVSDDTETMLK